MDIPWKNLVSNTEHLRRNAQSCIRTSSPALRWWCGESLPRLFGNPSSMVWRPHTYRIWPCRARQKYPCTVWSIIGLRHSLSAARCKYDTLSAIWLCYYATIMLTAARWEATKKTTISNTDDCQLTICLTTLVNSASMAPPIGLLPKMAKFCHTSNRLLVGRWCRRAPLWLYFNSSANSWLVGRLVDQSVSWPVSRLVGQKVGPQ